MSIIKRIIALRQAIEEAAWRFQRTSDCISLLAVSKQFPLSAIQAAYQGGIRDFGESHVKEAVDKITRYHPKDIRWHFIGTIQSNKTRLIAEHFHWVHSLSRVKHALRLNEQRPGDLEALNVCIQVNISAEAGKSGVDRQALTRLAHDIADLPRLRLRGIMGIPAKETDFAKQRLAFRQLHACWQQLSDQGYELDTLSMGMSNDLVAAIAEGSTLVRIGRAIFGQRP